MSTHRPSTIRRVGSYEIVDVVARGGMAVVYKARQPTLNRVAAVKELDLRTDDTTVLERFLRESRVAAALEHPNIVTVFDFFEDGGQPYIAMEYLARGSLRPFVPSLTQPQTFGVLEGVLSGLAHAQDYGLAHRDLKPENLLVTRRGAIKIADFGIAKAYVDAAPQLTADGIAMGTPNYMAPEQATATGSLLGPGTDLYAVGVMAFEMLAGRTPFPDDGGPQAVMYRHVNDQPPALGDAVPGIDPRLSAWVARMLEKDPGGRPAGAFEAWQALEEIVVDLLGSYWRRLAPIGAGDLPSDSLPVEVPQVSLQGLPEGEAARVTVDPGRAPDPAIGPPPPPRPAAPFYIKGPDATLEVRDDGDGAQLRHVARWQRPRARRRRDRLHPRPRRFENHVDRVAEIESLGRAVHSGQAVNVYGERAIGKTHVVVEALHRAGAVPRDGVIYLDGRGQSADDLLHAIFEEFYLCRVPIRDPRIDRHLRHRSATVAVEDVSLNADELRRLTAGAPRCRFILTSRQRVLWDGPGIKVSGMAAEHAPALAEQEAGRPLDDGERTAAIAIAGALEGHPLRLRQAFSRARDEGASLVRLEDELARPPVLQSRLGSLSPAEARVVRALAVYGGASIGIDHLKAVVDEPEVTGTVTALAQRHDVEARDGRVRLLGVLAHALPLSDDLRTESGAAVSHFTTWLEGQVVDADSVLDDMPAVLALIERAFLDGRPAEAIRLGRAAEGWLSSRQRWAAWGLVLAIVLACAKDLEDGATEGWALNQLGTRSLGLGRTAEAQKLFDRALEARRRAGDRAGTAATRQNLRALQHVPPLVPRVSHSAGGLVGLATLIVAVVVTSVGAIGRGGDPAPGTDYAALHVDLTGRGGGGVTGDRGRLDCGAGGCTVRLPVGTVITLVADAASDSRFAGWRGIDCGRRRHCRVRLTQDRSLAARFARRPARRTLALGVEGEGTISADRRRCSADCRIRVALGRRLTLSASPRPGWRFAGWTGDCRGERRCRLTIDRPRSAFARFEPVPAAPAEPAEPVEPVEPVEIRITRDGDGGGVVASGTGEACTGECVLSVPPGAPVRLSATPDAGSTFAGWTGTPSCSTARACTLSPTEDVTLNARFTRVPRPRVWLTVVVIGDERVTVDGRSCAGGCAYERGDKVTLRADHDSARTTVAWSAADCSGRTCRFTIARDTTVTATFAPRRFDLTVESVGDGSVAECAGRVPCVLRPAHGQELTLTALPGAEHFIGWTDCPRPAGTTCRVAVERATTVTARFGPRLEVRATGAGDVAIDGCEDTACAVPRGARMTVRAFGYDPASTSVTWSELGCDGPTCEVAVTRDSVVTAAFTTRRFDLTVLIEGPGRVSGCPVGVTRCVLNRAYGTQVELLAEPGSDQYFQEWAGCPEPDGLLCTVTVREPATVTVRFGPPPVRLEARAEGKGEGTVAIVGCKRTSCTYDRGTTVTLRADYDQASTTVDWSEPGCSGSECSVTLTADTVVTATFTTKEYVVTVNVDGSGFVDECPVMPCTFTVPHGEALSLTAQPYDSDFLRWEGCEPADEPACHLTVTESATVTAYFGFDGVEFTAQAAGDGGSVTIGECGRASCEVRRGITITVSASYDPDTTAVSWSVPGCSGATCRVTAVEDTVVTATFSTRMISYSVVADGPGHVSCGEVPCTGALPYGTPLHVSAHRHGEGVWMEWVNCPAPDRDTCTVVLTGDTTVTANFFPQAYETPVN